METFVKILPCAAMLMMCWQNCYVGSQRPSIQETLCMNNIKCPCCSVSCPNDGSGNCQGMCKNGYHGSKCYNRCPENCVSCVDADQLFNVANCTQCKNGYFSTSSLYQCQSACVNTCKTCEAKEICSQCMDGYYTIPNQTQCQSVCSSNCLTCDLSASKCTSCRKSFFLTMSYGCASCNKTCSTCHSLTKCTSCEVGFYLEEDSGTCHRCNPLCYACNSFSNCSCNNGCKNDSIPVCTNDTHECTYGCRKNFNSSSSRVLCDKCIDGKYGVECDSNCSDGCDPGKCERLSGTCHTCQKGFYGVMCDKACPDNCETCNTINGQCFSCTKGYFGISCNRTCVTNCAICVQANGSCTNCENNYYGSFCQHKCPENCFQGRCNMTNGACIRCESSFTGIDCRTPITTPFSTTTVVKQVITEDPNRFVGPITGGTVSIVLMIFIVVMLIVVLYRRRFVSSFKGNINVINLDEYDLARTDALEENHEFDPTYFTGKVVDKKKPCGKLPVRELARFVETHEEDFYQEEFLKLPRGLIKPCEDAKLKENVIKNRYTGIYPYDEHRVKLLPPGSDFINACHIDGFKTRKEYISSLGPTRKAMEGFQLFWRMVWQEKTDVIVMLANLMEGQSMKCEKYWPEVGSSLRYGNIIVTSHSEDFYSEFVVRKMTLSMGSENRTLNHLHYSAWPDKQVPHDVTSLIEFRQKVKATESFLGGPIIVHCSAGIGRTGTYIALDILIHQGKAQKSLDIFEWVSRMREQRTSMVQTWQQYEFLHRAVVHALTFNCEPIKETKFPQFMDSMTDKRHKTIFKIMSKPEKPGEGEEDARTINRGYDGLNREGADIPGSLNRPLIYVEKRFGECNYINAVYVNGYKIKGRFLVCQTPLPNTVKDFLTLITQETCSCIVSMDPPRLKDPTIGEYFSWTNSEAFIHPSGVYEVETQELDNNPSYILRKLTIQHNQRSGSSTMTVYHYQCHHWPHGNRVPDVSYFLQLVQDVDAMADRGADHCPVLVHCLNAAERSGLYCAVSNLVQKIGLEGEVSLINTLRQVKVRRPLAIPNKEQILFCYKAVQQFLDLRKHEESVAESAIYCNV